MAISVNDYDQRRLFYSDQGLEDVQVWTSDQEFGDEKCHICLDLILVLQAAKFFAETAGFDPSLPWEQEPR